MQGLRQMGAALNAAGDIATRIGEEKVETDYTDRFNVAFQEAQNRGLSQEAMYEITEDGRQVLKPFVPTSLDDITAGFRKGDVFKIQQAYTDLAEETYINALVVDAEDVAENALNNNPANPEGIMKAFQSFLEGLENSDDANLELINKAKTEIFKVFSGKINRSNHAKLNIERKDTLETNLKRFNHLTWQAIQISTSGQLGSAFAAAELASISKKQSVILDNLEASSLITKAGRTEIEKQYSTTIQSETAAAEIGVILKRDGPDEAYIAMEDLRIELLANPDVNGEAILQRVDDEIKRLEVIASREAAEISKTHTENWQNTIGLAASGDIAASEIDKMFADDKIDGGQAYQLKSILKNGITDRKSVVDAANLAQWNTLMSKFEYPGDYATGTFDIAEIKKNAEAALIAMISSGRTNAGMRDKFSELRRKRLQSALESGNKGIMANLMRNMGVTGGYLLRPEYYQNLTQDLFDRGIIGENSSSGMSQLQWEEKINSYATRYKKHHATTTGLEEAFSVIAGGAVPNVAQQNLIRSNVEPKNIVGDNGQTTDQKLDISSPTTGEVSLGQVINFSHTNNMLHTELQTLFGSFTSSEDPDYYNLGVQAFNKWFMTGKNRGMTDLKLEAIYTQNGGKHWDLAMAARFLPQKTINDEAHQRLIGNKSSLERTRKLITDNETTAEGLFDRNWDAAWKDNDDLTLWLTGGDSSGGIGLNTGGPGIINDYLRTFVGNNNNYNMSEAHEQFIEMFKTEHGVNSLNDIVVKNPKVKDMIMTMAYNIYDSGQVLQTEQGFQTAIRSAFFSLGKDVIGIEKGEDGKHKFVLFPILAAAQKSAGSHPVTITNSDLVQDFRRGISPSLMSPELVEALKDDDNIFFIPNKPLGVNGTWSVTVLLPDQSYAVLHPSYRYSFRNSVQNEVFKTIERKLLKSESGKSLAQILANTNMLGEATLRHFYNRANKAQQKRGAVAEFLNHLNGIAQNIKFNSGMPNIDPDKWKDEDIEAFIRGLGYLTGNVPMTSYDEEGLAK